MIGSWVAPYLAGPHAAKSFESSRIGCGCRWLSLESPCAADQLAEALETIKPDAARWKQFATGKLQFSAVEKLAEPLRNLFGELQAETMVDALRVLTGIPDLTPDRSFLGAGLHATPRMGRLGVHVDYNRHRDGRFRRLNLFLFCGNGTTWKNDWKGELEIWDQACKKPAVRLLPQFNRLVLFESTESSWHGQPVPVECPAGAYRLSLACYYFSESQPADYVERHSTIYREGL